MTMRKVVNFVDPVDERTAARLTQQLAELEDNADAETKDIRATFLPALVSRATADASGRVILQPGACAGFDTSGGNVQALLAAPGAKDAGRFLAVWKIFAANTLTLVAASGTTINRASSLAKTTAGLQLIFCDGTEYWA